MSAHSVMGAVPFPLFEGKDGWEGVVPKGAVLRLRSIDLALLQDDIGEIDFNDFARKLQGCSVRMLWACLKHGLKKPGGAEPVLLNQKMLDDLPFGPVDATPYIGDLMAMVYTGKTLSDIQDAAATGTSSSEATLDGPPLADWREPSMPVLAPG